MYVIIGVEPREVVIDNKVEPSEMVKSKPILCGSAQWEGDTNDGFPSMKWCGIPGTVNVLMYA